MGTTAILSVGSLGVVTGSTADALAAGLGGGGASGTVTVGSGGAVDGFGALDVNNGLVSVNAGGQVTVSTTGTQLFGGIGSGSGASGTLVVNGGTVSETGNSFNIGGEGASGTLLVENGGLLTTAANGSNQFTQISLGASDGGTAVATVNGGTWDVKGPLAIAPGPGTNDVGSLDVRGGAVFGGVVNAGTYSISIATQSGASGVVTVESGGTLLGGGLSLANTFAGTATGLLAVGGGGTVEVASVQAGPGGTITVGGGTVAALLAASSGIDIGASGNGALLSIGSLGLVSAGTAAALQIGGTSNGTLTSGTVKVGSGGTLNGTGALKVSNGVLSVNAGGLATIDSANQASNIGGGGTAASGTLIVDGGTLSDTAAFFTVGGNGGGGAGTLIVDGGGLLTTTSDGNAAGQIDAAGTGAALASVNDGTWDVNGFLTVGNNGGDSGTLDINNGLVNAGTNAIAIANLSKT